MKKISSYIFIIFTVLTSCTNLETNEFEYVPFQKKENGKWGMISIATGKTLFENIFDNEPTLPNSNRFLVKNENNMWEIYTLDEVPQKIGNEYTTATIFNKGKAIVAEKGKAVSVIDTDGKVLKTLDNIDKQTVLRVWPFNEGYAVYQTNSGYGLLDENGNSVIKAEYCAMSPYFCNERIIAIEKKYADAYKLKRLNELSYCILDNKGNKISEINGTDYNLDFPYSFFEDGLLPIYDTRTNNRCCGLIDRDGNIIIKPSNKINQIIDIKGDNFVYSYGGAFGIMNIQNEVLLRPQFDILYFDRENTLVAGIYNYNNETSTYKYIDIKGNSTINNTFKNILLFSIFNCGHTLVENNKNNWSIIDEAGGQLQNIPNIYNITFSKGDKYVENDKVGIDEILKEIGIKPNYDKPHALKNFNKVMYLLNQYPMNSYYSLRKDLQRKGFGIVEEKDDFFYSSCTLALEGNNSKQWIVIENDTTSYTDRKIIKWSIEIAPREATEIAEVIAMQTIDLYNKNNISCKCFQDFEPVKAFSKIGSNTYYSIKSKLGEIEFHISDYDDSKPELTIIYYPNNSF